MDLFKKIFGRKKKNGVEALPLEAQVLPEPKQRTKVGTDTGIKSRTTEKKDPNYSIITDQRLKILKALKSRELKHSQIKNITNMSHSNSFRHLKILTEFGYIERREREVPSISGKSSHFDIKTKTMKREKTAYFYELTKRGMYALTYFGE